MSKIDCLVEVRAAFFKKGDKTCWEYLENEFSLFSVEDVEKVTTVENQRPPAKDEDYSRWTIEGLKREDLDCTFNEDVIGFSFATVGEGRIGNLFSSGVEFESSEMGWDETAEYWREDLVKDALAMHEEMRTRHPKGEEDWAKGNPEEGVPPMLRWLVAIEYWTDGDGVEMDYDAGTNYLGRVKLQDMVRLLPA